MSSQLAIGPPTVIWDKLAIINSSHPLNNPFKIKDGVLSPLYERSINLILL